MKKVQAISVVVAGRSFRLERGRIEDAMRGSLPEPVRDHYVVLGGVRYPPKQVIAEVTGVDRADFTTNQARAILRRLGFGTGRASEAGSRAGRVGEAGVAYHAREADALRPHVGKWVAVKDGDVLVSAGAPGEILAWLRAHERRADAMFRVPLDPAADLGGFPG